MRVSEPATGRRALEVVVCLGDSVVQVEYLGPGQCHRAGATGEVVAEVDGTGRAWAASTLGTGGALRELAPGETVRLDAPPQWFRVREVELGARPPRAGMQLEGRLLGVLLGSVLAHVAFVTVLFAIPPESHAYSTWDRNAPLRAARLVVVPQELPIAEPPPPAPEAAPPAGAGAAADPRPEGKAGRPDVPRTTGRTGIQGDRPVSMPGRGDPQEQVENSGIVSVLRRHGFSPVLSDRDVWGADDANGYGPSPDGSVAMARGGWGGGLRGGGDGGCISGAHCSGWNVIIGTGRYRTISTDPGDGRDGTGRRTGLDPKEREAGGPPAPRIRNVEVDDGGLDREIVRRVIRSHLDEIRYCYDRALVGAPELEGRVTVRFVIQPNGSVSGASVVESTLGAPTAEGCITDAVGRWTFPASSYVTRVTRNPFDFHRPR